MSESTTGPDAVRYVFSHPEALSILRMLRDAKPHAPEDIRRALRLHPEAFRRARQALAGHGLVTLHAVKGARWKETPDGHLSMRVELEIAPKGLRLLPILADFGRLARTHRNAMPSTLLEEARAWG